MFAMMQIKFYDGYRDQPGGQFCASLGHLANRDRHWDDNMESRCRGTATRRRIIPKSLEVRNEISSPYSCHFRTSG
jgi:hypothetical protein